MTEYTQGGIEQAFRLLISERAGKDATARESAELTVPPVYPPEGWTNQKELASPYSSIGSQGVTSLGSQLAFALIPPNNIPFFEFQAEFPQGAPAPLIQSTRTALAKEERRVMNRLLATNLREALLDNMIQLTVVGDCLMIFEDDFLFRTVRFDNWAIERFATGRWHKLIYREAIKPGHEPASWGIDPASVPANESSNKFNHAYVEVIKTEKTAGKPTYVVQTEYLGRVVDTTNITKGEKYIVTQWKSLPGENYASSFVDEAKGDLRTAEGLSQSLVEGAAANSEFRWFVEPGGATKINDIKKSINGAFLAGRSDDVKSMQLDNIVQLQTTFNALAAVKKDLARKFLLQSELQPSGDRVTATQIRALAQSLEDASGGIFSTISRALQVPLVQRTIALLGDKDLTQLLDLPEVTLNVKTGLETLSREIEHQRVLQMVEALLRLPEQFQQKLQIDPVLKAVVLAFGQDPNMFIKPDDQLNAEQGAAQDQATQDMVDQQVVSTAGAIAEQGTPTQ